MNRELVVATRNKKKLEEIKYLLKGLGLEITSLKDYPRAPNIKESGRTFVDNAKKKAFAIARFTGKLTLGEDSGLEVDFLKGAPGVYSSRFSGIEKNDLKNNFKLLRLLGNLPLNKRRARYQCAVALADKSGIRKIVTGNCSGRIGFELKGKFGFGYDPIFFVRQYKKTFAQVSPAMKHKISHRAKAIGVIRKAIATLV